MAEAARLVGQAIEGPSAWLYATSGGDPLYLEQLARTVRPAGPISPGEPVAPEIELPTAVAAALAEELS